MSDAEDTSQETEQPPEVIVDYEADCDSLTARSVLTFQAGRDPQTNEPVLRILRNSGGGMFCKDWAPIALIDQILAKADPVTARSLNDVFPGRSANNGGFYAAVLKDLGLIRPKAENTRHHERVPGTTVLQALATRIAEANAVAGKTRRKGQS